MRLEKFKLGVAPEKTRILRFSRFHPSMKRRFTFVGFEFFWKEDRNGTPRVMRRTARKKLQGACRRVKEWIKTNRHLPGKEFFRGLNARLRGHYNYYGVRGNSKSLYRFFAEIIKCTFKWLNRRGGKRRSFTWGKFKEILGILRKYRHEAKIAENQGGNLSVQGNGRKRGIAKRIMRRQEKKKVQTRLGKLMDRYWSSPLATAPIGIKQWNVLYFLRAFR
jgi:Group II intron, maturase-specific domain